MYAIKGGWIGQTFALATCNESGGRKARIRRSKEERKAMVESFIKTYQSSNDGKFPSLNLTHKEVGGSFYTVREIVRDIIQENRVLGPAKFNSQKQKFDGNTGDFSVETATMESQDYLFQLGIGNPAVLDQQASAIMELNMIGNEQYAKHEAVNAGEFVGSSAAEECDKMVYMDSSLTESVGNNTEPEMVGASTDHYGNTGIELDIQGNKELDKHEDLDVEQLVNGSPIEEYDEVVSTESSVSEGFVVIKGSELGITDWQENANLELKLSDNEQRTQHDDLDLGKNVNGREVEKSDRLDYVESSLVEKHDDLDDEELVNGSPIEDYDEVVSTESSVSEGFLVIKGSEIGVSDWQENANLDIKFSDNEQRTKHDDLDVEKNLNGRQVEELDKLDFVEQSLVEKPEFVRNNGLVEANRTKLSNFTEDIVVETFPLRSLTKDKNTLDMPLNASEPVVQKPVNDPEASSNGNPVIVRGTIENDASNLMIVEDSSRSGETADIEAHDYNKLIKGNNFNGAKTSKGSANETQKENQVLERSKTLDRINLESWEGKGASKKLSEHERNPLLVFIKSLVSAFMKLLSE